MRLLLLVFAFVLTTGCAARPPALADSLVVPAEAQQLLLVVTPAWDATSGTLRRFERMSAGDAWQLVGEPVPIVVGRSGLGWGRGLHPAGLDGPTKREGDGRAPAGVFALTATFGYADSVATGLPYIAANASVECVDDVDSRHYNQVLARDSVTADWTSHEEMRRRDDLYRLGVIVDHNAARTPGDGSCIFLHIWRASDSTTSGCTAMTAEAMGTVAAWLDATKQPVLVQLPRAAYDQQQAAWGLP